eukprot:jgi/Psemu1/19345/gm1.19345_g
MSNVSHAIADEIPITPSLTKHWESPPLADWLHTTNNPNVGALKVLKKNPLPQTGATAAAAGTKEKGVTSSQVSGSSVDIEQLRVENNPSNCLEKKNKSPLIKKLEGWAITQAITAIKIKGKSPSLEAPVLVDAGLVIGTTTLKSLPVSTTRAGNRCPRQEGGVTSPPPIICPGKNLDAGNVPIATAIWGDFIRITMQGLGDLHPNVGELPQYPASHLLDWGPKGWKPCNGKQEALPHGHPEGSKGLS